jgi:hypothetical protein
MTDVSSSVTETSAQVRVASLPMAHVSIELGHLYFEDFQAGPGALAAMFTALTPWVQAAASRSTAGIPSPKNPRTSTCFLVDDYFSRFSGPDQVIPMILKAAETAGLQIDYLARESACAQAGESHPVRLALSRLVEEPVPGTTGGRPPLTETGWLTNGQRSPSAAASSIEAMRPAEGWQPPRESAARLHSIFADVELWDEREGTRRWSCAMLAAVWQVLRLGQLRDLGQRVADPVDPPDTWPEDWSALDPIIRLNPGAAAFTAYRTVSLLSPRFLPVEFAVRTILSQFAPDREAFTVVTKRARSEGIDLPPELVDRIQYAFVSHSLTDPA